MEERNQVGLSFSIQHPQFGNLNWTLSDLHFVSIMIWNICQTSMYNHCNKSCNSVPLCVLLKFKFSLFCTLMPDSTSWYCSVSWYHTDLTRIENLGFNLIRFGHWCELILFLISTLPIGGQCEMFHFVLFGQIVFDKHRFISKMLSSNFKVICLHLDFFLFLVGSY